MPAHKGAFCRKEPELTETEKQHVLVAVHAAAIAYVVEVDEIMGSRRFDHIAMARMSAYWLLRELSQMTLMSIGRGFDRDHGAVLSGVRRIQCIIDTKHNHNKYFDKMKVAHKEFKEAIKAHKIGAVNRKRKELSNALRMVQK